MEDNKTPLSREEVLARSRKENAQGDERLRQVLEKAEGYGFAGSAVAVILVGIIRQATIGGPVTDLIAVLFASLAASALYRWWKLRRQRDAWQAILWSAAALAELAVYATRLGMG